MAIIVEDGSIVAGANSYVSESDLVSFATQRGVVLTSGTEQLLIKAMDYIESLSFIGQKSTRDQGLQWPRCNVKVDGYYLDVATIPSELKNGLMQTAIAIDEGNNPLQNTPRSTKREKVGELEVEYMPGAASVEVNNKIMNSLYKLLAAGGTNGNVIRVGKA